MTHTVAPRAAERIQFEMVDWRDGDTGKRDPFYILIINSPAVERPRGSNVYVEDMKAPASDPTHKQSFADTAKYILKNLFGALPGQAEGLLSDTPYSAKIRFSSLYIWGPSASDTTALLAEDEMPGSTILIPRRDAVVRMLSLLDQNSDVVFIVGNSPTHKRASAFATTDDNTRSGIAAVYDGRQITHRFYHTIPGMAAIHTTSSAHTAAHEFGHAFSSYSNGFISDLYVDGDTQFNRKVGRPIPRVFCTYQGVSHLADQTRDTLGYPKEWQSFHSELGDQQRPALMDNYWLASGGPLLAVHDKLTKAYILDRVAAKVSR
jgi:hypothetical protein